MLTWDAMMTWSALEDQVSSEHAYNWYRNNLGINASARLFGLNDSTGGNYTKDSKKSKEYNAVNREYAQLGVEIEMYKQSLDNPINDMQRKLRDIDRTNPNNFEDYNISMNTYASLKKQQFDAIKEKASLIKNKHELLLKIDKSEKEGNGPNNGSYNELTNMAHVLRGLGSLNNTNHSDIDPALMGSNDMGTMDMATYEGKVKQAQRFAVATGNINEGISDDRNIGEPPNSSVLSSYMKASSVYGRDSLEEVYCSDPNTGFGYNL